MPSDAYNFLSAEDLGAILAWVKQLPPVNRPTGPITLGPIGKMLWSTGLAQLQQARVIDQAAPFPPAPPVGPTPEYGKYLTVVGGCTICHGPNLAGGIKEGPPGTPPSANLTPAGLKGWTEADFFRALREGRKPDGSGINPFMPWLLTRRDDRRRNPGGVELPADHSGGGDELNERERERGTGNGSPRIAGHRSPFPVPRSPSSAGTGSAAPRPAGSRRRRAADPRGTTRRAA